MSSYYVYVNGKFVRHKDAKVSIDDRGFLFSDGVYEVIAYIHGKMADEGGHFDRLERSLAELKMKMPVSREGLSKILHGVVKKNKFESAATYIQITRGAAPRDFKFPPADTPQTLVVTAKPHDFDAAALKRIKVITTPDIRWKRRDIKTVGLLAQAMARQEAVEAGCDEAWMVDDDGFVTEGAATNAWIVKDGVIQTRPVSHEILKGITRTALIKAAQDLGIKVVEKAFTPGEAYAADEAFSTGAIVCVLPAIEIDGRKIGKGEPGPVAKAIFDEYRAYVAELRGPRLKWSV